MVLRLGQLRKVSKGLVFVYALGGVFSLSAQAITQEIRASFVPDPANPQNNTFINQTPQSGYCAIYVNDCKTYNLSGLRLPLRFAASYAIEPGTPEREGAMFKMPAQWRSLTVQNVVTGEAETVEMRIGGFGSQYVLSDTAKNLTGAASDQEGHNKLWGGTGWLFPSRPCTSGAMGAYGPDFYKFFWRAPVGVTCSKQAAYPIPWMSYDYMDLGYELRTPNPLAMSAGVTRVNSPMVLVRVRTSMRATTCYRTTPA